MTTEEQRRQLLILIDKNEDKGLGLWMDEQEERIGYAWYESYQRSQELQTAWDQFVAEDKRLRKELELIAEALKNES